MYTSPNRFAPHFKHFNASKRIGDLNIKLPLCAMPDWQLRKMHTGLPASSRGCRIQETACRSQHLRHQTIPHNLFLLPSRNQMTARRSSRSFSDVACLPKYAEGLSFFGKAARVLGIGCRWTDVQGLCMCRDWKDLDIDIDRDLAGKVSHRRSPAQATLWYA